MIKQIWKITFYYLLFMFFIFLCDIAHFAKALLDRFCITIYIVRVYGELLCPVCKNLGFFEIGLIWFLMFLQCSESVRVRFGNINLLDNTVWNSVGKLGY